MSITENRLVGKRVAVWITDVDNEPDEPKEGTCLEITPIGILMHHKGTESDYVDIMFYPWHNVFQVDVMEEAS